MKTPLKVILTAAMLSMGALSAAIADDAFKIGFIVPNPIGDVGWDHELDRGRQAVAEHFGDKVSIQAIDSVGEGPDSTRVMNKMASQGVDMIFLGSFGHMNDGLKLAKQYPDLAVVHAGGYQQADNFATYAVRHYEGAYLAGMAAGYATKSNTLGVIAAFPLPEVVGIMNAYVLGAQSVNPNLNDVKVIWMNSWFDPAKNKASAESLVSQGADVVFSLFPGTPSAVAASEELGVYTTVTLSDNSAFAPTRHLAAIQVDFGPIMIAKVQEAMDGKFVGNDTFAGIGENSVSVAGLSKDLSEEQKSAILAKQDEIRSGGFHPFQGPITDNKGKEAVAAGSKLDDGAVKGMNFLVQGIDTSLPN
ncbi:BMP family ABC transporter substrate-binding protein [Hoeflea sp. TYP-13]|uniref:BMP family ABC transporter substrate-binding protein n=1 Tax=Hoeflea sp. TYP-13 TaxID=3230023 RepID=UPI0034C63B19